MMIVTAPYLTESFALALEYDSGATANVITNLAALLSEGMTVGATDYIEKLEEMPCKVVITDMEVDLP